MMSRSDKEVNISYTLNRNYLCLEFESFSLSQEIEAEKRAVSGGTKKVVSPRKETKVGGQVLRQSITRMSYMYLYYYTLYNLKAFWFNMHFVIKMHSFTMQCRG